MAQVNLLQSVPKSARDIRSRLLNKERNREVASKFGYEYFDGAREQGYGGYVYDGRWIAVARAIIDHFGLKPGQRVLDIGCAKGFLVHDLQLVMPELEVVGVDISDYALRQAPCEVARRLVRCSCHELPFAAGSFDLALAINTVHNLDREGCIQALREMQRVAPSAGFVQVDAYRNDSERQLFEDWMLTAKTYLKPAGWRELFETAGYAGDYYWTILEA